MKRHLGNGGVSAAIACCVGGLMSAAAQHPYRFAATVCIELTVTDVLSGPALVTMRSETSRIWLRQGIALTWTQPPPSGCVTVVSLVFDTDRFSKAAGKRRDEALAVTVFAGRSQTIYISTVRAFQMLGQLREVSQLSNEGERDLRGGTLIGRVVAHELGHVLLATTSHSSKGLMREVFGLRDVLSWDDQTIELLPRETDRLVMRFNLIRRDPGPLFARRPSDF